MGREIDVRLALQGEGMIVRRREFLRLGVAGALAAAGGVARAAARGANGAAATMPEVAVGVGKLSEAEAFVRPLGTQIIGAQYQFTTEARLVEGARVIREMGSNVIKFAVGRQAEVTNGPLKAEAGTKGGAGKQRYANLTELVRDEPAHRTVFDMPLACYVMWVSSFTGGRWGHGYADADAQKEYREIYDLTAHFLKTYNGTRKTFLLGHWEGDWLLRGGTQPGNLATPESIAGMIVWLNIRQKAVDDARRETPHKDVSVQHYTEVNLVQKAMAGEKTVTNDVLPKVNVDLVSYSSYDSIHQNAAERLPKALDYIAGKLPAKAGAGLCGRRVFIGEYGFPVARHTPAEQDRLSREVMRAGLKWGCPLVLYWELYNNEVVDGKQQGFWLIDDKGARQPVYWTHRNFNEAARRFVEEFVRKQGRVPMGEEFRKEAVGMLARAGNSERG